jgi:L-threonylcarbamoyladenylate synthase
LLGPLPWPAPAGMASTVLAWGPDGWQLLRAGLHASRLVLN